MADDLTIDAGTIRAFDDGARAWPATISAYPTGGSDGAWTLQVVDLAHGLPVVGPLTDAQLRAVAVPVSGSLTVSGNVGVAGTVNVGNFPASQAVTGPLTDTQLRAVAVPVSGTFFQATQPVSAAALPLPAGAASEATLAAIKAKTDSIPADPAREGGVQATATLQAAANALIGDTVEIPSPYTVAGRLRTLAINAMAVGASEATLKKLVGLLTPKVSRPSGGTLLHGR